MLTSTRNKSLRQLLRCSEVILSFMENHSEELQGDQLVLKKEEAYLNMLKRRGSYLSKHLSKLESDFLRKYSNRTDTERQFLPDVKIMFDIYEVLVSGISRLI